MVRTGTIRTVGVADLVISGSRDDTIITHALGSCLGVTVYDPVACVGGMLHVMLPLSTIDPAQAKRKPSMFVDTGVPLLFLSAYKAGARKERLAVTVAGGATMKSGTEEDYFEIGKRNLIMLKKLLWKNGVLLQAQDVGGSESRTMLLDMATGAVTLKVNGSSRQLTCSKASSQGLEMKEVESGF